jgi:ribosomal protein S17E
MGRIYGAMVRRIGDELLAKCPDQFGRDFANNKEKVKTMLETDSKNLTNKVSGYVTSRISSSEKQKARLSKEQEGTTTQPDTETDAAGTQPDTETDAAGSESE